MIIFSIDIETNGLVAGINSMISLGCAAIDMSTGNITAAYKANILPLSDLQIDPNTMKWWEGFPEAYKKSTEEARSAEIVMPEFSSWVKSFGIDKPVGAAWKPGFDMAFVRYYLYRFADGDIFGRAGSGLDIKTVTAIALDKPFSAVAIGNVPDEFKWENAQHTHDALDDAIEQGIVLYKASKKLGWNPIESYVKVVRKFEFTLPNINLIPDVPATPGQGMKL